MKKNLTFPLLTVLFAVLVSISSCTKEDLVIPYNLTGYQVCLQTEPNGQIYQVFTYNILNADVKAVLNAAGVTDFSKVKKARLKTGFKIKVDGAPDLSKVGNVEVYMKLTGTVGVGTQIAYSEPIADNAVEGLLLVNGAEMKEAITSDVTITVKVLGKTAIATEQCYKLSDGVVEISVGQ